MIDDGGDDDAAIALQAHAAERFGTELRAPNLAPTLKLVRFLRLAGMGVPGTGSVRNLPSSVTQPFDRGCNIDGEREYHGANDDDGHCYIGNRGIARECQRDHDAQA